MTGNSFLQFPVLIVLRINTTRLHQVDEKERKWPNSDVLKKRHNMLGANLPRISIPFGWSDITLCLHFLVWTPAVGCAEHQANYYTQVKTFEFHDEVQVLENKRKKQIPINIKRCNLLDSPESSYDTLFVQVTSTLLFSTDRTKQVLVAIDHKR